MAIELTEEQKALIESENQALDAKEKVLEVKDLRISFRTDNGKVQAVRGVSFDLHKGETLCIVGESGSGKSVTSKAIMGILSNNAIIEGGQIIYQGEDLLKISEEEFHRIRGHKIGMIFQDPLSSLNPIVKIGKQIIETMMINKNQLKNRYNEIISPELTAYKNAKVICSTSVDHANFVLADLKETQKKEADSLQNEIKALKQKVAQMSNPAFKGDKAPLEGLKADLAAKEKNLGEVKAKQASDLKEAEAVCKKECNEAKETYKKNAPALKDKLNAKKQQAEKEVAAYKKSLEDKRDADLADLQKRREAYQMSEADKAALAELNKKIKLINLKYSALNVALYFFNKKKVALVDKQAKELAPYLEQRNKLAQTLDGFDEEEKKIKETYQESVQITKNMAKAKALQVMKEVGIPQPEKRFYQYPFQFSGGMRQRIVIAIALTADPDILICDEPTTALDVTIQAQILELINKLKAERHLSCIFITHDLGVVANMADRVAVMYAGKICEYGTDKEIFFDPRHPYTWALLSSIPDIDSKEKLEAIPGTPPDMIYPPVGDAFAARNKYAMAIDYKYQPPYFKITDTHYVASWLAYPGAPKVEPPKIVITRIQNALEDEEAKIKNEKE